MIRSTLKRLALRAGYSIGRYDRFRDFDNLRSELLRRERISCVIDIGANTGQYATRLRRQGYSGRIVSFEPMAAAYSSLQGNAAGDKAWETIHCAIGDIDGKSTINIAGNSYSSSLLDMLPRHTDVAPSSAYIGTEQIEVRTLDSATQGWITSAGPVFMKVDAQGYTSKILSGANRSLLAISSLEVELSTVPLYEGEPLLHDVLDYLYKRGFRIQAFAPEVIDPLTGQQLQMNGLFTRQ